MQQQVVALPGGDDLHEFGVLDLLDLGVDGDEGIAQHGGEVALVAQDEPQSFGLESVELRVAAHAVATPRALAKVASGGELSRLALAVATSAASVSAPPTLIFDEIDTGVGGAVADAIGARLARMADGLQVLAVTHSPQVAALGAHHWRVQKSVVAGQTLSEVLPLSTDDRIDEIARMLSGDTITEAARGAARALVGA